MTRSMKMSTKLALPVATLLLFTALGGPAGISHMGVAP